VRIQRQAEQRLRLRAVATHEKATEVSMASSTQQKPFNVLFLCTGNSARSIIAEVILNRAGRGNFRAYSAGSHPKGQVHPYAIDLLRKLNFDLTGLRSKSWTEFAKPDAPKLDFVFTVCDDAAKESCPVWPGQPMTAHWGIPDPAAVEGTEVEKRLAFSDALRMLTNRINIFVALPLRSLSALTLQNQLNEIGKLKASNDNPVSTPS
jgi:protein-tyrosine-phosphatase